MGAKDQRQPLEAAAPRRWSITIEAKSKVFDFSVKLRLASFLPYTSVVARGFSFVLNCHHFRLKLQSDSGTPESLKSKFNRYIGRIFKSSKSSSKTIQRLPSIEPKSRMKPSTTSSALVSINSFLSGVMPDDTQGGIVMLSSLFLFIMKVLFNRLAAWRRLIILVMLIAVSSHAASSSSWLYSIVSLLLPGHLEAAWVC